MTLGGTVTSTIYDVTMTEIEKTDTVLRTLEGGYCWTFYDGFGNEVYVELTADAAISLRDKLMAVVADEDWMKADEEEEDTLP